MRDGKWGLFILLELEKEGWNEGFILGIEIIFCWFGVI